MRARFGDETAVGTIRVARGGMGPLSVSRSNRRYFADGTGRPVYLAGMHTWSDLQDNGTSTPPPQFDFDRYLRSLQLQGHNVLRLWAWEQASSVSALSEGYFFAPSAYLRPGPGLALDGKPRFDVGRFDPAYFARLRQRVIAARTRGIYVIVMLFNGWSIEKKGRTKGNPWHGHPFNGRNNVNGVDGDVNGDDEGFEIHTLAQPAITRLQERYVARVIEAVGDQPNVLYEISNESAAGSMAWQEAMTRFIHGSQRSRVRRQPVVIGVEYPDGQNASLFATSAEAISPNGDVNNPDAGDGRKVVLADTDHLCGVCGDGTFPWRALTRGLNPMFMDVHDATAIGVGGKDGKPDDPRWEAARRALGATRILADRLDLSRLTPRADLCSTGFCLADPSARGSYVAYLPLGGSVSLDLRATPGRVDVEWIDPLSGFASSRTHASGGVTRSFSAPNGRDAVLVVRSSER